MDAAHPSTAMPDKDLIAELADFVAIPSISADPAHADDVRAAGAWICTYLRHAGGTAELIDWHGQPLAIGEIRASHNPDAPTVMVYGHFDVQSPEPLHAWDTPPFEATVRNGWLYGRGTADDKGQLYLLLRAACELSQAKALPVNVRFCCDGEEETGGHSIVDFLKLDDRHVDACVIFDTAMPARGLPAFVIATRGLLFFRLRVRTGLRDVHSGVYGGAAGNALHVLTQSLSAIVPRNGRLPEPLRSGVASEDPPDAPESLATLPSGAEALADAGAVPADDSSAQDFYVRTWSEPSLDIHGISGGSTAQQTIVPSLAEAAFSIRLVADQQVQIIAKNVEILLRNAAPPSARLELDLVAATAPARVTSHVPAVELGLDAFERALGVRPCLVRSGGTLPIVSALQERGVPTIVTGFDVPTGSIHAPNERLLIAHIPSGIAAARELFLAFGNLPRT